MPKRILEGVVVSDKGDKTVIVKVERTFLHPVMKKTVRSAKKYYAHDESNACAVGDIVKIEEHVDGDLAENQRIVAVFGNLRRVERALEAIS